MIWRGRSVRRARRQKSAKLVGYIVTWDVDSRDPTQCTRLRRFVFGHTVTSNGRVYRYAGFVELDGVRYLGQSVVFVSSFRLAALREFLFRNGIDHVVTEAVLGSVLPK